MLKRVLIYGLFNSVGGVQQYIMNIQNALEERIAFTFLLTGSNNRYESEIKKHGGTVLYIPESCGINRYFSELYKVLKKCRRDIDCIYVNIGDYTHKLLVLLTLARYFKYKVVVHSHAAKLETQLTLLHRVTHFLVAGCGRCLCRKNTRLAVSQRAGKYMFGKQRFDIVHPGVELERFRYSKEDRRKIRALYNCEDHFVLGVVGRLVYIKNYEFAIRVFARFKALCNEREVTMLIVGDGDLRRMLEKYVDELEISQCVHFVGMTNKVSEYYNVMDCLLGTSFSEGLPLGIVEAQVSGLPCICAEGNYPKEIAVTDLVHMIPLEKGPEEWAKSIIRQMQDKSFVRSKWVQDHHEELKLFDQRQIAQKLYDYLK